MQNEDIVVAVDEREERRWRAEVESRSTLVLYRMKDGIRGECYDNSWGSRLLFRVRSNVLRLN